MVFLWFSYPKGTSISTSIFAHAALRIATRYTPWGTGQKFTSAPPGSVAQEKRKLGALKTAEGLGDCKIDRIIYYRIIYIIIHK